MKIRLPVDNERGVFSLQANAWPYCQFSGKAVETHGIRKSEASPLGIDTVVGHMLCNETRPPERAAWARQPMCRLFVKRAVYSVGQNIGNIFDFSYVMVYF